MTWMFELEIVSRQQTPNVWPLSEQTSHFIKKGLKIYISFFSHLSLGD